MSTTDDHQGTSSSTLSNLIFVLLIPEAALFTFILDTVPLSAALHQWTARYLLDANAMHTQIKPVMYRHKARDGKELKQKKTIVSLHNTPVRWKEKKKKKANVPHDNCHSNSNQIQLPSSLRTTVYFEAHQQSSTVATSANLHMYWYWGVVPDLRWNLGY